jgi:hypothetical protein
LTATMQRLGDLLHQDPNPVQAEATNHVLDIALAWYAGQLSLSAVRDLCTGFERWQAMRFADQSLNGWVALRMLVDRLVDDGPRRGLRTTHGIINAEELHQDGVKCVTNWDGKRVWVWPLLWMNGEPQYAPIHLPPGPDRREIETAMLLRYDDYMKAKRKARGY